jgi:hypothetical protein
MLPDLAQSIFPMIEGFLSAVFNTTHPDYGRVRT